MSIFSCCCFPRTRAYVQPDETKSLLPPDGDGHEKTKGGTFESSEAGSHPPSNRSGGSDQRPPSYQGTPPLSHRVGSFTTPTRTHESYEGGGNVSPNRPNIQDADIDGSDVSVGSPPRTGSPTPSQPTTPPANQSTYQGGGDLSPIK